MSIFPAQKTQRGGGKRAVQKARTRQRMIAAGRKLFSDNGYEKTTIAHLAAEAEVSPGLFSAHFGSKAGLLFAILTEETDAQLERIHTNLLASGTTRERLLHLLRIRYEHNLIEPKMIAILVAYSWVWPQETEQDYAKQRQVVNGITHGILADGVARGEVSAEADLDAATTAVFAIFLLGIRAAFYGNADAGACLAGITPQIDLLLRGLAPKD